MAISGNGAVTVTVDGKPIKFLASATIEHLRDMLDKTSLGDTARSREAGMRSWSVSLETAIDFTAGGQAELIQAMIAKKLITIIIGLEAGKSFSGKGYIDSLGASVAAGEKASMSLNITGSGALTQTL